MMVWSNGQKLKVDSYVQGGHACMDFTSLSHWNSVRGVGQWALAKCQANIGLYITKITTICYSWGLAFSAPSWCNSSPIRVFGFLDFKIHFMSFHGSNLGGIHFQCPVLFHCSLALPSVIKSEVFNALQTRFGTSKYTSLETTLQNATPNEDVTWSPLYICPPQEPTNVGHCHHMK